MHAYAFLRLACLLAGKAACPTCTHGILCGSLKPFFKAPNVPERSPLVWAGSPCLSSQPRSFGFHDRKNWMRGSLCCVLQGPVHSCHCYSLHTYSHTLQTSLSMMLVITGHISYIYIIIQNLEASRLNGLLGFYFSFADSSAVADREHNSVPGNAHKAQNLHQELWQMTVVALLLGKEGITPSILHLDSPHIRPAFHGQTAWQIQYAGEKCCGAVGRQHLRCPVMQAWTCCRIRAPV